MHEGIFRKHSNNGGNMNLKNNTGSLLITLIIIFLLFTFTSMAHADSMLSNSPPANDEESEFHLDVLNKAVDEPLPVNPNYLFICEGGDRIWGPESRRPKPKKIAKAPKKKKYKNINVRYRTYLGSGKYQKKLSSRGRKGLVYVNITPIIISEAKKNGISPVLLKAVIQTESGFNNYAVGPSGAQGLCQLMPTTARRLGVRNTFNPYQNIAGGAKYLGMLSRMFKGNLNKILAAYNLGPGGVRYGIPSYGWHFVRKVKKNMYW